MNKKLLLSLLLLIIATYITNAQSISKQVIGSGGVAISNGTHSINFTIGESIVGEIQTGETIHQGFWAAVSEENTLGIENHSVLAEEIAIFPNPASNFIQISYKGNVAKDIKTPEDLSRLSAHLTKLTVEAALNAEIEDHLGYSPHGRKIHPNSNCRNGYSPKTLKGDHGEVEIFTPRDRDSSFSP